MNEIFEQVSAVSESFVQCQLHKNECLLLQATVLVNAGNYYNVCSYVKGNLGYIIMLSLFIRKSMVTVVT